jgi:formylglycine-generating enzyme
MVRSLYRILPALVTTADPDLARIPAGDFLMGAADADEDERPVHRVFVSEFYIGRFPVTNDDYARFVRASGYPSPSIRDLPIIAAGDRGALFRGLASPYVWQSSNAPPGRGNHPVVLVRYDDAVAYCGWLSQEIDRVVRLPTEAEWEKASRGGAEGLRFPWGHDISATRANFLVDKASKGLRGTRPVGTYEPNGYGIYDMTGNVWEWVSDWYGAAYYETADAKDPSGPSSGTTRVVRGGSWVNDDVSMLRCAYRHRVPPDTYAYSIGFRIVCEA